MRSSCTPPAAVEGAKRTAIVPRLALRWPGEVAATLGVSADTVERWGVIVEVPCVRRGRLRLVPVAALAEWVRAHRRR